MAEGSYFSRAAVQRRVPPKHTKGRITYTVDRVIIALANFHARRRRSSTEEAWSFHANDRGGRTFKRDVEGFGTKKKSYYSTAQQHESLLQPPATLRITSANHRSKASSRLNSGMVFFQTALSRAVENSASCVYCMQRESKRRLLVLFVTLTLDCVL